MDQLALQNINTLLSIDEKSTFIFEDRKIIINKDESTEHINENNINTEYVLYFTFNQLFNAIRHENININPLIDELELALENLYGNESFLKLIDNDKHIDEIMNDISLKLDIIIEKYYNRYQCNKFCGKLNDLYISWGQNSAGNIAHIHGKNVLYFDNAKIRYHPFANKRFTVKNANELNSKVHNFFAKNLIIEVSLC